MTGEAPQRESASPEIQSRDDETPDTNRLAMVENMRLMAGKGWLDQRKLQALHDFLMARRLYADFNSFIRGMR